MVSLKNVNELTAYLIHQGQMQFKGRVDLRTAKGKNWSLYYWLGRIVWATGGLHPCRRWYRLGIRYFPGIDLNSTRITDEIRLPVWDYQLLTVLRAREEISQEQAIAVIKSIVGEVLFDMMQQIGREPRVGTSKLPDVLENPGILLCTEEIVQQSNNHWQAWCQADLAEVSPNLSPKIEEPLQLQQHVSRTVYKNLVAVIDGNRTLREMSVQMKKDLLLLTRSLAVYIRKDLVSLKKVADLPPPLPKVKPIQTPSPRFAVRSSQPLIACVDDSPQTARLLKPILEPAGYGLISIQDSINAVTEIIEHKPDFIFLDLVMPVVNGYEICHQLRRVSQFKKTPIIILTSHDGIVDRVRAKVVGGSGFLTKPIEREKVIATVQQFELLLKLPRFR